MKALFLALLLTGCAGQTVVEASVGYNVSSSMPWSQGESGGFDGANDVVRIAIRKEHTSGMFVEWSHTSHLSTGWPVNSEREDWLDAVSVGYRFQVQQ